MRTTLTPRQFGVIADYMAAGNPLAVAALAAGVLPPVAEEAIESSPWFAGVLEASRALQTMPQPEWLDRVRRIMRGVIERAVAEERVSLLHLAARQVDAMAPEKFDRMEEKRGVEALLHAMSNMTYGQLVEWQSISRRGPAWAAHSLAEAAKAAPSPAEVSASSGSPVPGEEAPRSAPPAPTPAPAAVETGEADSDPGDDMKAMLRERCPWPAAAPAAMPPPQARLGPRKPGTLPVGGFPGAPFPTEAQAADPRMAPAPDIRPPEAEPVSVWPWQGDGPEPQPSPDAARPRTIPMPRVILSRLPLGSPIPGWIEPEPPGGWRQRPT